MNTIMENPAVSADRERFLPHVGKQARRTSPRLGGDVDEIVANLQYQPDITLGELRAALLGTGFTWSPDGKLAYKLTHVTLIEDLEALIEAHGWDAKAAEVFF